MVFSVNANSYDVLEETEKRGISLSACVPVIIVKHSGVERLDEGERRYRVADDSRVLSLV